MENLSLHIEYLLTRHDCVIIPTLGAFIVNRMSAKIDSDGSIIPPMRLVGFNPALRHDDGLLADSYRRRLAIPLRQAHLMLDNDITTMRNQLADEKEVAIGRLGVLSESEEGNILFAPALTPEAESASIGLKQLRLTAPKHVRTEENNTLSRPENGQTYAQSEYYHLRISKRLTRIAAAVTIMLAVCMSLMVGTDNPGKRQQQASVIPVAIGNNAPIDSVSAVTATESVTVNTETHAGQIQTPANDDNDDNPVFHLIVATFASAAEAEAFIEANSDFNGLHDVAGTRLHRVAASSSNDRKKIQKLLNSKEISQRFDQAWIFEEK